VSASRLPLLGDRRAESKVQIDPRRLAPAAAREDGVDGAADLAAEAEVGPFDVQERDDAALRGATRALFIAGR
jgi:hypothetical protein